MLCQSRKKLRVRNAKQDLQLALMVSAIVVGLREL